MDAVERREVEVQAAELRAVHKAREQVCEALRNPGIGGEELLLDVDRDRLAVGCGHRAAGEAGQLLACAQDDRRPLGARPKGVRLGRGNSSTGATEKGGPEDGD